MTAARCSRSLVVCRFDEQARAHSTLSRQSHTRAYVTSRRSCVTSPSSRCRLPPTPELIVPSGDSLFIFPAGPLSVLFLGPRNRLAADHQNMESGLSVTKSFSLPPTRYQLTLLPSCLPPSSHNLNPVPQEIDPDRPDAKDCRAPAKKNCTSDSVTPTHPGRLLSSACARDRSLLAIRSCPVRSVAWHASRSKRRHVLVLSLSVPLVLVRCPR